MKHSVMTWRKETRLSPVPPPDEGPEGGGGSAFDLWLRRSLHQLYDDVAKEPVPEELLRLIEEDRALTSHGASPEAGMPGSPDGPVADGPVADGPLADGPVADGPLADAAPAEASKEAPTGRMGQPAIVRRTKATGQ